VIVMDKATARALLGIDDENPTKKQVNEAYRNAARLNHPDNYAGDEKLKEHAERQMRLINEARQVLLSESEQASNGGRRNRNENNRNAYTAYVQYWDYVRSEDPEDSGNREHERAANRTKSSSGASNSSSASRSDAAEHPGTSSKTDIPQSPKKPVASPANGSSPDTKRENGCVLALIIVPIVIVMFTLLQHCRSIAQ
jgi:curved DNA-binding protein CbpA